MNKYLFYEYPIQVSPSLCERLESMRRYFYNNYILGYLERIKREMEGNGYV